MKAASIFVGASARRASIKTGRARWRGALLLSMAGWLMQAHAAPPATWLDDMNRAFTALDYDGVFSYYAGADMATLRVVHMVVDGERQERLAHLNGPPREIIRRGASVACILSPDDALAELAASIPAGPFARAFSGSFDRISSHYGVSYSGLGRVAGRAAHRIAVTPKDRDRYGYRLWLDRDNRLLLRSELVDADGARLELFQFTHILFGEDVSPAALEPDAGEGMRITHFKFANSAAASLEQPAKRWRSGWVPAGFSMAAADIRHTPAKRKQVNTLMYTDGLTAFSIFVEDMPSAGAASLVTRNGATIAITDAVRGPAGQRSLVTLVGELPEPTARRIARSVFYGAAP